MFPSRRCACVTDVGIVKAHVGMPNEIDVISWSKRTACRMFALEQQKLKVSDERSSEKYFVIEMWKRDLICKITLIFCGCNDIVLEFKVGDRSHMVFNAIVSELFVTMVQWGSSSFLVRESIWHRG